jgi:hypothetical protein
MSVFSVSEQRRREVIDALRRGTVPSHSLDTLAVGLGRFEATVGAGDHRSGCVQGRTRRIRGGEDVLHALARHARPGARAGELGDPDFGDRDTAESPGNRVPASHRASGHGRVRAQRAPSSRRLMVLRTRQDVIAEQPPGGEVDEAELAVRVEQLIEQRLAKISPVAPSFAAALRAYRQAAARNDPGLAEGLIAWVGGQPSVGASVKRAAGIRGQLDHDGALGFLQGLLTVLGDCGYAGLVMVLDEVETLQRVRGDIRDKALNALRQLIDDVDAGRFPGLVLVITGTPAFFDGPQGIQRLAPLAQRLHVDFLPAPVFDNPRAVQVRLPGFTHESLLELGAKVRELYMAGCANPQRVASAADDGYVEALAKSLEGQFGGRSGVAPRIFVKKLVDLLDRVDQHPGFDPRRDYVVQISAQELADEERAAMPHPPPLAPARSVDEIDLPS